MYKINCKNVTPSSPQITACLSVILYQAQSTEIQKEIQKCTCIGTITARLELPFLQLPSRPQLEQKHWRANEIVKGTEDWHASSDNCITFQ